MGEAGGPATPQPARPDRTWLAVGGGVAAAALIAGIATAFGFGPFSRGGSSAGKAVSGAGSTTLSSSSSGTGGTESVTASGSTTTSTFVTTVSGTVSTVTHIGILTGPTPIGLLTFPPGATPSRSASVSSSTRTTASTTSSRTTTSSTTTTSQSTSSSGGVGAPTIGYPTAADPVNPGHNGSTKFMLTGTNFADGLTVTGNGSATVTAYTWIDAGDISVTVQGSGGLGARGSFTVANPGGSRVTSQDGSFVNG